MHNTADSSRITTLLTEHTPEEVYSMLLAEGWKVADIQRALASAKPVASPHSGDLQQRVVTIILVLGALMVGAGIFSTVAANWDSFSSITKITLLTTLTALFHVAAFLAKNRVERLPLLGRSLHLLGSLSFGGAVFLIASTSGTQVTWADSFAFWMLGVLAVAYALDDSFAGVISSDGPGTWHVLTIPLLVVALIATTKVGWFMRRRELAKNPQLY
jgi:hypothetical protein